MCSLTLPVHAAENEAVLFHEKAQSPQQMDSSLVQSVKNMFEQVLVRKQIGKIADFFTKDAVVFSNGNKVDYQDFVESQHELSSSSIQYAIAYDQQAWLSGHEKVAGRVFITLQKSVQEAQKIEVIFIAEFQKGKIKTLWELAYPDLSSLSAVEKNS